MQLRVLDVVLVDAHARMTGSAAAHVDIGRKLKGNGGNSEMQRCRNATSRPSTSSCISSSMYYATRHENWQFFFLLRLDCGWEPLRAF